MAPTSLTPLDFHGPRRMEHYLLSNHPCLSSDRFADAILLVVRGRPEHLQRTQKAYFERRTMTLPYLLQSIVSNDLSDIVQNADLQEWREIFVVICTFASGRVCWTCSAGSRLEHQFSVAQESDDSEAEEAHIRLGRTRR